MIGTTSSDTRKRLLIVDDDEGIRRQLRWSFNAYEVAVAGDRRGALAAVESERPAVVLLDLGLPPDAHGPKEGLAVLEEILATAPETKVIVMTGQNDRRHAVRAVGAGAYDFYQKPIEMDVLGPIVDRAYHLYALEEENRRLTSGAPGGTLPGIIATSAAMRRICREIRRFAPTDVGALIVGESGTGKEVLARAIHEVSGRPGRFVAINCAAIPDQLLESELFGYEKGAFTGADKTTRGKAELADGGTLFLDEIGDMSLSLQAKLLRFLQDHLVERVGGRQPIPVDVRVVSATNQDLSTSIADGTFREDLYYRLSAFVVEIPPLRDRPEDAVVIANYLLERFARQEKRSIAGFTREALAAISAHSWPGNVRELENRIRRAVLTATGGHVGVGDLELGGEEGEQEILTLQEARAKAESRAIAAAMLRAGGRVSQAAKLLGISRPKLYDLLETYKLKY